MSQPLTERELAQLISLAKRVLWAPPEIRERLQAEKVNITPANFYSNIPLVHEIENSFEYRDEGRGIYNHNIFDSARIESFIDELCQFAPEFNPPIEGDADNPSGYFWSNPAFSYSDAMAYYCILRLFKPSHVLEVGSGYSTLVADQAIRENGVGTITVVEPYPKPFLRALESVDTIIDSFVQDIPLGRLVDIVDQTDVWFIDSTHTVKIGSDCLYLYLMVMPEVSNPTIVHAHDIYLPFGMPSEKALISHVYWTEQYLLYAYMLDNPKTNVLFSSVYAHRNLPKALERLMLDKYPSGGGSIWFTLN